MKTIIWLMTFCIVASLVVALPPSISPIDTLTATEAISNTFQVHATDPENEQLQYFFVNEQRILGLSINSNTGVITFIPQVGQSSVFNIDVMVRDPNLQFDVESFNINVQPVLALTDIQVGRSADIVEDLDENRRTIPFKPGDTVYFQITIRNRFTLDNHPLFHQSDVEPILEEVELTSRNDGAIQDFPVSISNEINLLEPQAKIVYRFSYQLPFTLQDGEYDVEFIADGIDQDAPATEYQSRALVSIVVARSTHDVKIVTSQINGEEDTEFSCVEKQNLNLHVNLANIGRSAENLIVTVSGDDQDDVEQPFQLAIGQEGNVVLPLSLQDAEGDSTLQVSVTRAANPFNALTTQDLELTLGTCSDLSFEEFSPEEDTILIDDEQSQDFSVNVNNPDNIPLTYNWLLDMGDEEAVLGQDEQITLAGNAFPPDEYSLTLLVNEGQESEISHSWTVRLQDRPSGFNDFPGVATTNIETEDNIESVGLVLENQFGKLDYDQKVDLSSITDISDVVTLTSSTVAVNSADAPELNQPATITLNRGFTNPIIQRAAGFNQGAFGACNDCRIIGSTATSITFSVPGFSTYRVNEAGVPGIEISPIEITGVRRSDNVTITVTVTNTDDAPLTNVAASFENVAATYGATITRALPRQIAANAQAELEFNISIPANEVESSHSIGSLRVSGAEASATTPIIIDPVSFLVIESIKINGKTSGDLQPGEDNEIEVKVRNDYDEDMEDVVVTVRILDVDNDDLEEESEEFDLDSGDDDEVTITFNLAGEDLDDDDYTIEVEVEAEATDDTEHQAEESKTIDVERERHDLVITRASLASSTLQCARETILQVNVENQGKSDEDDVEIRIRNTALGLDQRRTAIELDDFSRSDNDISVNFQIEVPNAAPGTYPITIEVVRDDEVEETQIVNLVISACTQTSMGTQGRQVYSNGDAAADALRAELARNLAGRQTAQSASSVTASFRDSSLYIPFLAALAFLILIALIMAVAVGMKSKKPRRREERVKKE